MKTKYIIILIFMLLISACSNDSSREEVLLKKYETAYNELVENDKFVNNSEYYNLEVIVTELEDQQYRVDVILDQAQVAMYNVQMIMELNPQGLEQYKDMIPSLGIVDDTQYNLIPNQVNKENGFYAGLVLSAITDKPSGDLQLMIQWSDYSGTKDFEEFIELQYSDKKLSKDLEVMDEETEENGYDE